jgi:hypothetical protein
MSNTFISNAFISNAFISNAFMKSVLFLIVIIALSFYLAPLIRPFKEGFIEGKYPISVNQAILDDYPLIGKNSVSNDSASTMWWHYPIFSLQSFKQQTNNLRYRYNPDDGTCSRPEFCGALYHNIKNKSNEVNPLPPAEEGEGARVGYFRTEPNQLFFSIPTNENILY